MHIFLDDERWPTDVTWVDIGEGPWVVIRSQASFQEHVRMEGLPRITF